MLDAQTRLQFEAQAAMLANRVQKRHKHLRKRFARQQIEVFRLYDWDIPEIRAVVDWYAGHLVVGEYVRQQSMPEWLPLMGAAAARALDVPPENLHLKARIAGKQDGQRYARIDTTDRRIVVAERDFKFYVNPYDYVDTGLFADHRDTRQMVREMAAGKDLLNLYCYTGSFSCYAARGGARRTLSVDRSETAIRWARDNLLLNDLSLEANILAQQDAFVFLKKARLGGLAFDLAVVDPPSYSTTRGRGAEFDLARDHPRLLKGVVDVLRKGATLIFSTNHQGFEPCFAGLQVSAMTEITHQTIPEDYASKRRTIHRCWRITV